MTAIRGLFKHKEYAFAKFRIAENQENDNYFIYNKDEITFNNTSMSIKNEYKLSNNLNSDTDLYESDVVNKNDFIEISEVKLNG